MQSIAVSLSLSLSVFLSLQRIHTQVLNELAANLPVHFVRGSVRRVLLRIPWHDLLNKPCQLEIDGLELVVEPICDTDLRTAPILLIIF